MRKIIMSLLIGLALMIVPSMAATGHINGCTNTGTWNNCCTKTFNITAKPGYRIVDVIVNGVSKGAITSYTFGNLTSAQTLKVITEAIQEILYTVSFNSNGGTGTMEAETFTEGTAKNLTSNTFTRTGYTFKEWNTNPDGTGTSYADGISYTATGDVTLYAQWTPVSYTISYNLDGGTVSGNPTSYTIEDAVTLVNPTKDGYNFTGWTGSNETTPSTTVTITKGSTGDRTYTANWESAWVGWNKPVLTAGLTPVNWNGSSWTATTESNWDYNYNSVATATHSTVAGNGDGKWANAQTSDGSLYVWIPRYSYKITSGEHQSGNSWNSLDNPGTNKIEVKFSNGTTDDTSDSYIAHPAFTFGEDNLLGFWIAKYEASQGSTTNELLTPTGSLSVTKSLPNISSWRGVGASNAYNYAYNTYRSADSHLTKNAEWGAIAYLTNAIGRIPYINNTQTTGKAGNTQNASSNATSYEWNTSEGVKASTTHNIYGIYDMSGGAYEYVSAYYSGGEETYLLNDVGVNSYGGKLYENKNTKYVEVYDTVYSSNNLGDAMYETSNNSTERTSWDGDLSGAFDSSHPIFGRGGNHTDAADSGIFYFCHNGSTLTVDGFRVTLAPQTYIVSFNANGGTGTMGSQKFMPGVSQTLSANTFSKAGYIFAGWSTTASGEIEYLDQENYVAKSARITLYAKWYEPGNYTIVVRQGENGTISPGTTIVKASESATFNITPNTDYIIKKLVVDGDVVDNDTTYSFNNITASHTITAAFELSNSAPTTPTVTLSSKTTSSFTVNAVSTDVNGDSLIYKLYVDGTLKNTSSSLASGTSTTFTVTGLGEYTSHTYYVTVSDGKLTTTGNTNSVSTYCSGKGCNGNISATTCSRCKGYGYNECRGSWKSVNNYSAKCPTCGEYNNGGTAWGKYTCSKCSEQLKVYLCSSCGNGYYAFGSSDFTVTEDGVTVNSSFLKYHNGDCYSCKGNGTRYECSSCNNTFSSSNTSHCTHGKTSQHD